MKIELNSYSMKDIEYLESCARIRGVSAHALAHRVMRTVLSEQLILAVLDDAPTEVKAKPPVTRTRLKPGPGLSPLTLQRMNELRQAAHMGRDICLKDWGAEYFSAIRRLESGGEISLLPNTPGTNRRYYRKTSNLAPVQTDDQPSVQHPPVEPSAASGSDYVEGASA